MSYVKELHPTFQQLDSLLYVDPEDLKLEILIKLFQEALKLHDYSYEMSDDNDVYMRGRLEENILSEHVARQAELETIYKAYWKEKNEH